MKLNFSQNVGFLWIFVIRIFLFALRLLKAIEIPVAAAKSNEINFIAISKIPIVSIYSLVHTERVPTGMKRFVICTPIESILQISNAVQMPDIPTHSLRCIQKLFSGGAKSNFLLKNTTQYEFLEFKSREILLENLKILQTDHQHPKEDQ